MIRRLGALMLLSTPALAEDVWVMPQIGGISSGLVLLRITMGKSPEAFVAIKPTGEIEYGKDYTPDAAAKALWDAIGTERAARNCK